MKQHFQGTFKGFLLGFLVAALLIPSTAVVANMMSPAGQVFTGLGFFINGVEMNVRWDEEANTVHLTSPQDTGVPQRPSLSGTMLGRDIQAFRLDHAHDRVAGSFPQRVATIMGVEYAYGFRTNGRYHFHAIRLGGSPARGTASAFYNIGGRYTTLTGYFGPDDDSRAGRSGTFVFFGDGRQLESFEVTTGNPLRPFSVDVSGVTQLRIDFIVNANGTGFSFAVVDAVLR